MVWTIAITRIKLLLQSPWSWAGLILPVCLLAFFDLTVEKTAQATKIPVVIVDEDTSEYSKTVIERVRKNPAVAVRILNEENARNEIETQKAAIGFLIPEGFMEHVQKNDDDELVTMWLSTGTLSHGLVREIFASEVKRLSSNSYGANTVLRTYGKSEKLNAKEQASVWKEAWAYSDKHWEPVPLMTVNYKIGATKEKAQSVEDQSVSIYVPGMLVVLMLFSFLWNTWPIKDRDSGMRSRVPYSVGGFSVYWGGNALGVFILQLVLLLLLAGFGWWKGELLLNASTVLALFGYIMFLNALSLLFSFFVHSHRTWQALTLFVVLATSLLSGTFFPSDELSSILEKAAQWTPQYWMISALNQETLMIPLVFVGSSIVLYGISTMKAGDNA
ncbi:ABC transporter permease [Fictibacillus phosphorivorans]|uniref:ABC transporter permease n=1 Tax=Fictibacillus phosphorivorans TaxID=1221500 RepID=UPI00203A6F79|nr:ABC transporter permease [Fictibacillus phosphorivorans]MCM3717643.1 ABC transporter permease [Fictibacillus phosphorivorans]MCM3775543.1 ABC transporter permease [Fictibacillus phosphorivorans]